MSIGFRAIASLGSFENIMRVSPRLNDRVALADRIRPLALATILCGLTTAVAAGLLRIFDLSNVVILFLLVVVYAALQLGRAAGLWAALLSVGCFDFFFVPPRLTFAVSDTQYFFTLVLMLSVALLISHLASRLQAQVRTAVAGQRREAAVARMARTLSAAIRVDEIEDAAREAIAELLNSRIAFVLPNEQQQLTEGAGAAFVEMWAAQEAYEHGQTIGPGTATCANVAALYIPLIAPVQIRGVLAVQPRAGAHPTHADELRLLEAFGSSIALALERIHFVEVAQRTMVQVEGERFRNTLLAAVSHDLRTPLTAIRGLAETLEYSKDGLEPERRQLARAIWMQADGLRQLVSNLLDLARMQSQGIRLNREWHSLSEIVGSVLAHLQQNLSDRAIDLELPDGLPLVELDALMIERAIINLVDNALKFTPPTAAIRIGARADGNLLLLFVEDEGPGLPTSNPEELFALFARGTSESAIQGVGLGLALCRSVILAHGGTISAMSRVPHGARFEIRLPLGCSPIMDQETLL